MRVQRNAVDVVMPAEIGQPRRISGGGDDVVALVEQGGRRGVVDMNPTQPGAFTPIDDVELPAGRVADRLYEEQCAHFAVGAVEAMTR